VNHRDAQIKINVTRATRRDLLLRLKKKSNNNKKYIHDKFRRCRIFTYQKITL